jgi:hypothetical protein
MSQIAEVTFDRDDYLGDGREGVYFSIAETERGWYVSAVAESRANDSLEPIVTDDGPYETPFEADAAGADAALIWCACNDVEV